MYYICIIRRKRRNECYDATYSYILNRIYYRKKKQKNKIGQSDCKPEDFSFIRCKILKYKISLSNDYIIESFDFILSSPVFPHRNENVCYLFFFTRISFVDIPRPSSRTLSSQTRRIVDN